MNAPMLQASDLRVHYGGIQAVKGISLRSRATARWSA